jgi:hypothetical protein
MQYNTPASNTLLVKVRVKPNKKDIVQVFASFDPQFTSANAICYSELPVHSSTTLAVVQAKIESFRAQHNALNVDVSMQSKVVKLLAVQDVA